MRSASHRLLDKLKSPSRAGCGALLSVPISAGQLLDRCDVKSGESDAATIIEPNHDSITTRIDAGMIGAGYLVAMSATRHDGERLERPCFKVMAHIFNHGNRVTSAAA